MTKKSQNKKEGDCVLIKYVMYTIRILTLVYNINNHFSVQSIMSCVLNTVLFFHCNMIKKLVI